MPLQIAIAEDNSFALSTTLEKLALCPDLKIMFIAFNGEELLEQLQPRSAELILMDIIMPGMGGIESAIQMPN